MTFPWLAALVLLDLSLRTRRTRRRLRMLPVLAAVPGEHRCDGWRVVSVRGVAVDPSTRRAAVAHAVRRRLQVVDLVPGNLHAEPALELLRHVDPAASEPRRRRKVRAIGGGHAVVVERDLAHRAAVPDAAGNGVDPAEFIRLTTLLRRYAPRSTGLAVAPGLPAVPPDPRWRKPCLRALSVPVPLALLVQFGELAGLVGVLRAAPLWGLLPLLLFWAMPSLVFTRAFPVRPPDLLCATVFRPPLRLWDWLRAVAARSPHPQ